MLGFAFHGGGTRIPLAHFSNKCSKKAPINYHIYNNDNNDATIRFP